MRKMIIVFLLGIICLTGCAKETASDKQRQFFTVEKYPTFTIVCDRNTDVLYTVSNGVYNSGDLTLLVDADGKPLLYDGGDTE